MPNKTAKQFAKAAKEEKMFQQDIPKPFNARETELASAIVSNMRHSRLTRFDVLVEDGDGNPITTFPAIAAQTRKEAVHKAISLLQFTAERCIG